MSRSALPAGFLLLAALAAGCHGPMTLPAIQRLPPEEQLSVDQQWHNMLTPVNRLDDTLLLDVIIFNQFHERGVNRATFVSEKDYDQGVVRMTVTFEAARPQRDSFTIEIMDLKGQVLRRARFPGSFVLQRIKDLTENPYLEIDTTQPSNQPATGATTEPAPSIEALAYQKAMQERWAAIAAATQPAP